MKNKNKFQGAPYKILLILLGSFLLQHKKQKNKEYEMEETEEAEILTRILSLQIE